MFCYWVLTFEANNFQLLFLILIKRETQYIIQKQDNICEEIYVYYGTIKWNPCLGSYFQCFEVLVLNVHFQFGMNKHLQAFRPPSSAFNYFLKILTSGVYCFVKVSTALIHKIVVVEIVLLFFRSFGMKTPSITDEIDMESRRLEKDRERTLRSKRVITVHNPALLSGLAYCISSCSMILVNKYVLSSYNFNAGISLMLYQVIFCTRPLIYLPYKS